VIELALDVLDVLRLVVVGVLFAAVAWGFMYVLRESSRLDDPPRWPETPGARNDRQRLLGKQ
jgi:hypothetical protein